MAEKKKSNRAKQEGFLKFLKRVIQGRFFSLEFFKNHWGFIVILVGLLCVTISNRYVCQNKMKTIIKLQNELVDAKTNRNQAESKYKVLNVPSNIKILIDNNHMDLRSPETPQEQPIKIKKQPRSKE